MPIPTAQEVKLSAAERQGLEKLVKRHQVGQQTALRARIVLAAAAGLKNKEIVAKYEITADTVRLWRNRWVKLQGISLDDLGIEERLDDAPRPGAPAKITADQRCQIEALACEKPENSERPISQWSAWEIADEVLKRETVTEISPRHAARLLKRR
jgi:putative transposase